MSGMSEMSVRAVYLGIGSNLGNRERRVLEALRYLESTGITVVACSSLYESEPAEGSGGGRFINAVVEVRTLLCPADLLNRLKTIEKSMGRTGAHNRPREIDIDIVSLGDTVLETADLVVPHPRFGDRAFVLLPLKEIAPGFRCPLSGRGVDDMIGSLGTGMTIARVSGRRVIAKTSQ
jgi:2-amino-4-hydroxy-6-hydroxymethyldihydropteridine diphosphokinase